MAPSNICQNCPHFKHYTYCPLAGDSPLKELINVCPSVTKAFLNNTLVSIPKSIMAFNFIRDVHYKFINEILN